MTRSTTLAPLLATLLGAGGLASAQEAAPEPPARAYHPAVVLLVDGRRLRGEVSEGRDHLYLRYPEGTFRLPIRKVEQYFPHADVLWPPGLHEAWTSRERFRRLLDGRPQSVVNALVARALLGSEGRAVAAATAQEIGASWLLRYVAKGAVRAAEAETLAEAYRKTKRRYGRVVLGAGGDAVTVEGTLRVVRGRAHLDLGDAAFVLPEAEVAGFEKAPRPSEEEAAALRSALFASAADFAAALATLDSARANALLLRALASTHRDRLLPRAEDAEDASLLPTSLLRLALLGTASEEVAEACALRLVEREEGNTILEEVALAQARDPSASRQRIGLRLLSTLYARADVEDRPELLRRWEAACGEGSPLLPSLWLALGHGARAERLLADVDPRAQPERAIELARTLAAARWPFDPAPLLPLLEDPRLSLRERIPLVDALRASLDPSAIPVLVRCLEAVERSERPPPRGYPVALQRCLATLSGRRTERYTAELWAKVWDELEPRIADALDAIDAFVEAEEPAERLAAWQRASAARVPLRPLVVLGLEVLADSRDPRLLREVIATFGALPPSGRIAQPLVRLLRNPDVRDPALKALRRMFRRPGPPRPEAWIPLANRFSYMPPFGSLLPAEDAWWEEE